MPRTFLVFLTLFIFSSLLDVLELDEDDPLPELESLDDDELELDPLDEDFELTFFLRG
jgi:hypothetical protein